MSLIVLLDAGPLGLVTNPRESQETQECSRWIASLASRGDQIRLPEIADYEVRRELLRAGKTRGIRRLDALKATVAYLPITTAVMLTAAAFWAEARRRGRPSAPERSHDADMILAAQAISIPKREGNVIIATGNMRHLALFADARHWRDIG